MRAYWFLPLAFVVACIGSRSIGDFAEDTEESTPGVDDDASGASGPVGAGGVVGPGPGPGVGGLGPGVGGFGPGAGGLGPGGSGGTPSTGGGGTGGMGTGGMGTGGSGGSAGPIIDCVNETCGAGQVCCHDLDTPSNSACGAPGSCAGDPIEISCQHPSDCPGEICCGWFDAQGFIQGYEEVTCDPVCGDPPGDIIGIIMCGADPSVCPGGAANCVDSNFLPPGFNYCQ